MPLNSYKELRVFQNAMTSCMDVFDLSKRFPTEERFSLVDQIRRSSRSVCANIAEAWKKRRFQAAFTAKLDDAAGEAAETQVWLEIARRCNYMSEESSKRLDSAYEQISAQLIAMAQHPEKWLIPVPSPAVGQQRRTSPDRTAAQHPSIGVS